jgi:azurin
MNMKLVIIGFALSVLPLAACTKSAEIELSTVGDTMAFDKTTLEVKAGATVKLHFKNNATSAAMQHSFILVQPGKDNEVAMAGLTAGASKDYIPESPFIIAKTKLLKPSEEDTITFTAPATEGDYPFICTFPGHYPMMKGNFKVN